MAAKRMRTADDDHLPPEIWREVLVRVPAKSILRCRSVCKSWYSLVSCPDFISYYETLNKNRKNRLLLQHSDIRSVSMSFTSLDESFMESREHDDFPELYDRSIRIVGSCNGLICLFKYRYAGGGFNGGITFLIWNPTIRKVVELTSRHEYPSYLGFGFDSKTGDYKILCATGNVCKIFDLNKGVWRSVIEGLITPPWILGTNSQECYLDGTVHWNATDILLSFNMSDECFRKIEMPDSTELQRGSRSVTFGGLIYLIVWNTTLTYSIWVMKEYGVAESWTLVSNIDLPNTRIWPDTSLLWKNGEVLMVEHMQNLVSYNSERRIFECVFPMSKRITYTCLYEESLVLM